MGHKTSQVTYVTMVPRGNEMLRRKCFGEHHQRCPALNHMCNQSKLTARHQVRKKHVTCSRRQLPGMKHSSSRDARSMALRRSVSFPRGTMVTYVNQYDSDSGESIVTLTPILASTRSDIPRIAGTQLGLLRPAAPADHLFIYIYIYIYIYI